MAPRVDSQIFKGFVGNSPVLALVGKLLGHRKLYHNVSPPVFQLKIIPRFSLKVLWVAC